MATDDLLLEERITLEALGLEVPGVIPDLVERFKGTPSLRHLLGSVLGFIGYERQEAADLVTPLTTEHPQVRIKYRSQTADVDEGIAPLIMTIWRCGIRTMMSCQEGAYGYVWLCFPNTWEASKFMNIIAVYAPEPDSFYQRMLNLFDGVPHPWKYKTNVDDYALFEETDEVPE